MNALPFKLTTGTFGELFVQFRFLQFGVQAAPPLKDTGNDLIAVRGPDFRAISVRSTTGSTYNKPKPKRRYDILAVVEFRKKAGEVLLDKSEVYLVPHAAVAELSTKVEALHPFRLSKTTINQHFPTNV